jgi:hypothetical protein
MRFVSSCVRLARDVELLSCHRLTVHNPDFVFFTSPVVAVGRMNC